MITKGIVQIKLEKKNLTKFTFSDDYKMVFLNKETYQDYLSELLSVSKLMKQDFDWIGIPDESSLRRRFDNNSYCLLFYYKEALLGWVWANDNLTPLYEDSVQKLKSNEIYAGGVFLSKKIKRPPNSGLAIYQMGFGYFLNMKGKDVLYSYIDDWNEVSIKLAYKIGYKDYNFIK